MTIDTERSLLQLTPVEYEYILKGLKELKNDGLIGDFMTGMLDTMLFDKKKMTPLQLAEYEEKERIKLAEKAKKEEERLRRNEDIDILIAKLTLLREMKKRAEANPDLVGSGDTTKE